jgi:hypothetical protein
MNLEAFQVIETLFFFQLSTVIHYVVLTTDSRLLTPDS